MISVEYEYMGSGRSVVKDYPQPEVHLDLWGGTPGSMTTLPVSSLAGLFLLL